MQKQQVIHSPGWVRYLGSNFKLGDIARKDYFMTLY